MKFLVIALLPFHLLCWTLDTGNSMSSVSVNEDSTVEKNEWYYNNIIITLFMNMVLSTDGNDIQAKRTVHFSRELQVMPEKELPTCDLWKRQVTNGITWVVSPNPFPITANQSIKRKKYRKELCWKEHGKVMDTFVKFLYEPKQCFKEYEEQHSKKELEMEEGRGNSIKTWNWVDGDARMDGSTK